MESKKQEYKKNPTERNKEEEILIWKTKKKSFWFSCWVDGFYIRFFFSFFPSLQFEREFPTAFFSPLKSALIGGNHLFFLARKELECLFIQDGRFSYFCHKGKKKKIVEIVKCCSRVIFRHIQSFIIFDDWFILFLIFLALKFTCWPQWERRRSFVLLIRTSFKTELRRGIFFVLL